MDALHWVRLDGRFGTDRADRAWVPPISLPRLRQTVNERSASLLNRTQYPSDLIALVVPASVSSLLLPLGLCPRPLASAVAIQSSPPLPHAWMPGVRSCAQPLFLPSTEDGQTVVAIEITRRSEPPASMRQARLRRLEAAQELFIENLLGEGAIYVLSEDHREIGYAITDRADWLLEIHIEDKSLPLAEQALEVLMRTLGIRRILTQSFDPLAMFLGLARGAPAKTGGLLYRVIVDPGFEPRSDIIASAGRSEDVGALAALSDDFFHDRQHIHAYLAAEGLIAYRDMSGTLIGAGVLKAAIPGLKDVDIGMIVSQALRRRGYGVYIVRHLKAHCLSLDLHPVCGCAIENIASQRTLERAGFASVHRSVEFALLG
jgi:RimJ/RimL family protein N-acetyltransferase